MDNWLNNFNKFKFLLLLAIFLLFNIWVVPVYAYTPYHPFFAQVESVINPQSCLKLSESDLLVIKNYCPHDFYIDNNQKSILVNYETFNSNPDYFHTLNNQTATNYLKEYIYSNSKVNCYPDNETPSPNSSEITSYNGLDLCEKHFFLRLPNVQTIKQWTLVLQPTNGQDPTIISGTTIFKRFYSISQLVELAILTLFVIQILIGILLLYFYMRKIFKFHWFWLVCMWMWIVMFFIIFILFPLKL